MPLLGALALGPVLHLGLCDEDHWRFTVNVLIFTGEKVSPIACPLVLSSPDEDVVVSAGEVVADLRAEKVQYVAWRWHFEVPRLDQERWISYRLKQADGWVLSKLIGHANAIEATHDENLGNLVEGVCVPARGCLPRIAAHSCSWFSNPDEKVEAGTFARWDGLYKRHLNAREERLTEMPGGFHLQIGGGDQIYADALLKLDFVNQLWNLPNAPIPTGTAESALHRYLELYSVRWSAAPMAKVLARIPGAFTWDDHEIMDGWGSYGEDLQGAKGRQILWGAARRAFEVVQLGARADLRYPPIPDADIVMPRGLPKPPKPKPAARGPSVDPHFLQSLSFREAHAELHIVLLDLRSERSMDRVMADEHQWMDLERWLQGFTAAARSPERAGRKRHLILVSSIPPLFLSAAGKPENLLRAIPGAQEFEDDLRDQWESDAHKAERERLLERLFQVAQEANCAVTVLSGDIHVGAHAEITKDAQLPIHQLVSSGMVHPAPGWIGKLLVKVAAALQGTTSMGARINGRIVPLDQETFLTDENYLQIRFDDPVSDNPQSMRARMHAQWRTTTGAVPKHPLVIEPPTAAAWQQAVRQRTYIVKDIRSLDGAESKRNKGR